MKEKFFASAFAVALSFGITAQSLRLEPIRYGNFEQWITRNIKESAVLGGKTKKVYEIGPTRTITGAKPYVNAGGSPWATSNVYAKVMGVVKASNAVEPYKEGGNTAVKMQTIMEHVKALGFINMDVLVAGSIFIGQVFEPISSTKNPYKKMEMGMPYTKRPKALVFDYKVDMPNVNTRVRSSGMGSKKTLPGRDQSEVYILLQRRWEDEKGNIYAHRIGTGRERYYNSTKGWVKGHQLPIHYGDITKRADYKSWQGLLSGKKAYYARNSKGKLVPVQEVDWGKGDEQPTHVLVMASSGCGEAFVGTVGVTLYIDNIAFGF